ncbi:MAG: ABC transporter ATP-binding protein [Clostridiaceae bacterium]|nr:ABC transporter ATP-binding protein [Clostridiaceae bacterium]
MVQPVLNKIKPYGKRIAVGQSFKFTEVILELIVPLLIARMVDRGITGGNSKLIIQYTVLSLGLAVCGMLCAYVCQYNASVASQSYGTDLRNDLYSHILGLAEKDIHKFGTASLTSRITSDIQTLQQALAMLIRLVPRTPFICIGSLIMVTLINVKFLLIFLLAVLIFVLILFVITKSILPLINRSQRLTDRLIGRLLELLEGIRVIRAVSRSEEKAKQYHWTNEDSAKIMQRIGRLSALLNPLTMLALNLIAVFLLWISAGEIRLGNLHSGEVIALINYLTMLLTALTVLSNLVLLYTRSYASALRVGEIFMTEKRIRNPAGDETAGISRENLLNPKQQINGKFAEAVDHNLSNTKKSGSSCLISFKQVDFAYPNSSILLFDNLSFALPQDKSLGIIGPTGSGKSSLVFLLERRYPIQAGKIELFDRDINLYSEVELLNLIQIVPQSSSLFSGTLRDSLTVGTSGISDDEIWHALTLAQAKDFVEKDKQGLEQRVERGGGNYSGGQRQRLCIARALLRKPAVLIFDDSSSALDLTTDAALQKALRNDPMFEKLNLITISQRVATVSRSDLILLMNNGEIAGFGTDRKLLAENELYQEIYRSQTEVDNLNSLSDISNGDLLYE